MAKREVAILGAGIMGSAVALFLARKGFSVKLFDQADRPFSCASRWNEGKIHLGYLYSADPSLRTAKKLIPGGVMFPQLVSQLVGRDISENLVTPENDRFLIHKHSVVTPDRFDSFARKVSKITSEHPGSADYFISLKSAMPRRLELNNLKHEYNTEFISGAFEVPERSVRTTVIADHFVEALEETKNIELIMRHRVDAVEQEQKNRGWTITTVDPAGTERKYQNFRIVVNALWEGRQMIDSKLGIPGPDKWTHRYRLSVFAKTKEITDIRSAVVAVGPFGDIKNYDGKYLYLSWYETGLLAEGHDLSLPVVNLPNSAEQEVLADHTFENLSRIFYQLEKLPGKIHSVEVKGGWVFAAGRGQLHDPLSDLHRRDKIGQRSRQGYISVDTGKYSIAPYFAKEISEAISGLI